MTIAIAHRAAPCARRLFFLACCAGPALGATPGHVQDFVGAGNLGSFSSGGGNLTTNPGADGVGGAGDGYLRIESIFMSNFGCATSAPEFTGDFPASGVGGISFWLRDVGAAEATEIHFLLGQGPLNHWQFNAVFVPTAQWRKHYINLATINVSHWTNTHPSGTFADAIGNVARINFRHDLPPYEFSPDPVFASIGLDRVRLHGPCAGETNGDDVVDFADLNNCLSNFGGSGINLPGDVNADGAVSFPDLNIILSAFGTAC